MPLRFASGVGAGAGAGTVVAGAVVPAVVPGAVVSAGVVPVVSGVGAGASFESFTVYSAVMLMQSSLYFIIPVAASRSVSCFEYDPER